LRKVEEKFSSWAVLKDKEKLAIALEGVVHFDDEWMSYVFLHEMISESY